MSLHKGEEVVGGGQWEWNMQVAPCLKLAKTGMRAEGLMSCIPSYSSTSGMNCQKAEEGVSPSLHVHTVKTG